ncbi:MAG: glycosyltransferase [Erysipelotrichaceae bacterium]|nr:glycosyltransferase [Erysipelotrichaceae bacterium]
MKKILIISHAMEIGGAERALLGLLNSFDYNKYSVDLFLSRHEGELYSMIPSSVNILPENQARYLAIPIKQLLKEKQFSMLYGRLKSKILAKKTVKKQKLKPDNQVELTYSHKYTYQYMDVINPNTQYDMVISFLTPHYVGLYKCNANIKIAWIHTDYSYIDIDTHEELKMWSQYDYIVSISDNCTKSFLQKFPSLENKIVRIDNIITEDMIKDQSEEFVPDDIKRINDEKILCSIGRFSNAKNFDNIPNICKKILDKGINVKWYLIGFGGDEQLIRNKIQEEHMADNTIILGKKNNPYPYINACDFYIQPSRYEGKAVTVREAQILHKPVVITRFPTSSSQLVDGYDGIIVDMDNEGCAQGIVDFINNKELQETIINNLKNNDYSNSSEVDKVYKLLKNQNE